MLLYVFKMIVNIHNDLMVCCVRESVLIVRWVYCIYVYKYRVYTRIGFSAFLEISFKYLCDSFDVHLRTN